MEKEIGRSGLWVDVCFKDEDSQLCTVLDFGALKIFLLCFGDKLFLESKRKPNPPSLNTHPADLFQPKWQSLLAAVVIMA